MYHSVSPVDTCYPHDIHMKMIHVPLIEKLPYLVQDSLYSIDARDTHGTWCERVTVLVRGQRHGERQPLLGERNHFRLVFV